MRDWPCDVTLGHGRVREAVGRVDSTARRRSSVLLVRVSTRSWRKANLGAFYRPELVDLQLPTRALDGFQRTSSI